MQYNTEMGQHIVEMVNEGQVTNGMVYIVR